MRSGKWRTVLQGAEALAALKAFIRRDAGHLHARPRLRPLPSAALSVIGFDGVNAVIIGHDGLSPNSLIGREKFNKEWTRAGRWMLVIEPVPGAPQAPAKKGLHHGGR